MSVVKKPWGEEAWMEVNDKYVVKKLFMKGGSKCSLQYHEKKLESFFVLYGKLNFTVGDDINNLTTTEVGPGFFTTIQPGTIHRMSAIIDSEYLECSTIELDDVVRLKDDFGRVK